MNQNQLLFLVYDDSDFAEWIEDELAEYGRLIRSIDSLDFFIPQWSSIDSAADVIIIPETVIKTDESFLKIYQTVRSGSPETVFLLIYFRAKDEFTTKLEEDGNVCVSFDDLDAGLLEARLRGRKLSSKSTIRQAKIQRPHPVEPAMEDKNNDTKKTDKAEVLQTVEKFDDKSPIEPDMNENREYIPEIQAKNDDLVPGENELVVTKVETSIKMEQPSTDVKPKKGRTAEEQKVKLQKIKERIVIEEKIVTVHVPVHFNSILVSVVSLYPRAGATFVTANFARMLGENKVPVAVFEPVLSNIGSTYYELMHGETNAPKDWKSWAEQIQKNGYITNERSWVSHGVNWIPANVNPTENWTDDQTMQLLLAAKRFPVALCDISSHYQESQCKKILSMSDEIWIVTDGDPIQLNHHLQQIDSLKNEFPGKQMRVIGNKWGSYIKQNEWKDAVALPSLTQIPDLGGAVLKHAWEGTLPWDDSKMKNLLSVPFRPMARAVIAKEMYALMKKQYGIVAKMKGLFSQMKSLEDESKTRTY